MSAPKIAPVPLEKLLGTPIPLEEQIRTRAHEIYLQRGGQVGSDLDDWLQAEAEVQQIQEDKRNA